MYCRNRASVLGMCIRCVAGVSILASSILIAALQAAMPQGRGGQNEPPQPAPKEMIAPDIPGVIRGGTKVTLIRDGFKGTEGVISMPDGSMLFTEQDVDKIIKIDNNGNISTYLEHTNRTIGLAYDHKGRLIATQSREPRIAVMAPTTAVLADAFEGQPLVRPNDLVIDRNNGIYFTDPIPNPEVAFRPPPPGRKPLLFYITPAESSQRRARTCRPSMVCSSVPMRRPSTQPMQAPSRPSTFRRMEVSRTHASLR